MTGQESGAWIWSGPHKSYYRVTTDESHKLVYEWFNGVKTPVPDQLPRPSTSIDFPTPIGSSNIIPTVPSPGGASYPYTAHRTYAEEQQEPRHTTYTRAQTAGPPYSSSVYAQPTNVYGHDPSASSQHSQDYGSAYHVSTIDRSESAPPSTMGIRESPQRFEWVIDILYDTRDGRRSSASALALLDTQSQGYGCNWISESLLNRLNKASAVAPVSNGPTLSTPAGPAFASGKIGIEFRRQNGNTFHECECFVFPQGTPLHFDVIFGQDFINEHNILTLNQNALLPMLAGSRQTSASEQAIIAAAKAQREREIQAAAARQSHQSSSAQSQGGQQGQS